MRAVSWCPWIPGTLKLDSILSLFKCGPEEQNVATYTGQRKNRQVRNQRSKTHNNLVGVFGLRKYRSYRHFIHLCRIFVRALHRTTRIWKTKARNSNVFLPQMNPPNSFVVDWITTLLANILAPNDQGRWLKGICKFFLNHNPIWCVCFYSGSFMVGWLRNLFLCITPNQQTVVESQLWFMVFLEAQKVSPS